MQGNVNIALIKFQITGDIEKGDREVFEQRYKNVLEDIATELNNTSKSIEIRPPSQSERITIRDREDAAHFAESINAHIVVYGTLDLRGENVAYLQPEIYIAPHIIFDEGAEITGSYRLGDPIFIPNLSAVDVSETIRTSLENRLQTLMDVGIGLTYYTDGDYGEAQKIFEGALENTAWGNPDVIFLLSGNAALKLNQLDEAENYYNNANDAFQAISLESDTEYARALIGLGSVAYIRARGGHENKGLDDINPAEFMHAIQFYKDALVNNNAEDLPVANVDVKAHFGLGQTYLQKAIVEQYQDMEVAAIEDFNKAEEMFDFIIEKYEVTEAGNRTQLAELSALAHAHMGLIEFQRFNFKGAAEHYAASLMIMQESDWACTEPVVKLRTNSEEKLLYLFIEKLNDVDSAVIWLRNASEAPKVHCEVRREWYQEQLKSLEIAQQTGDINDSKNYLLIPDYHYSWTCSCGL